MIVPPLDRIPKLPGKAVSLTIKQLNTQTDRLMESVNKIVQDSIKLPEDCKCDDIRVKQIKKQLTDIQSQITKVQEVIPKIQQTIDKVNMIVEIAQGIKAGISIAQLSNPVTAPVFIAQQLTAIQDATIINAIESLNQFSILPVMISSKISTIVPPLLNALSRLSNICDGDVDTLSLPSNLIDTDVLNDGHNDLVQTNFYNELNVSDEDLNYRSDVIDSLLEQQQNLLTSLNEAPSKVYQGAGTPSPLIGKVGDYYIDNTNQTVFGPKATSSNW